MREEVCVLGIDPGTITMGYGVVQDHDNRPVMLNCGVLTAPATKPFGLRLRDLYLGLVRIVERYQPDDVAIEEPFVAQNIQAAFAIGRAQAIAILAAANQGICVYQYPPAKVKQAVTSYGTSTKDQVQEMVRAILRLPQIPQPADAADALAVALCHLQERRIAGLIGEKKAQL
jgi:crossover junction endodeoxyribonuclease RuvC